jgi:2-dehydro-3-deoxyphosphogluconate aldolase/(4S)-4-hydroxy-2-oxoglutarate aldolase
MTKFSRIQVAQVMADTGLVPLFYHKDPEVSKKVLKACYDGGARLMEFTNRGDFAHEVFGELSKYSLTLPGMILGAGSVQDAGTASLFMQLGAAFIVSPFLKEEIALVCNRRKVMYSPGCGSLNDISRAEELGVEVTKVFPGGTLGPGFIKAVKGPCPWSSIMPTGGVSPEEENLQSWFEAGAHCVGMGSKLLRKDLIEAEDYQGITGLVSETLELIKKVRPS